MNETEDRLWPIGEAARQLGVSVDTVRRWEKQGKIAAVRGGSKHRRFRQSEIDRILNRVAA